MLITIDLMGDGGERQIAENKEDGLAKDIDQKCLYEEWLRRQPQPQLQIVPITRK